MTRNWTAATVAGLLLAVAASLAGCAGGGAAGSGATASAGASSSTGVAASALASATPELPPSPTAPASAKSSVAPSASPEPAASSLPASPPVASLRGLKAGGPVDGSLGTYTWAGGGSEAPWIVGKPAGIAAPGAKLEVGFGGLEPTTWTAAWAKVQAGTAGAPVGETAGAGAAAVTAPTSGGDWSLRVTADFGPGASATYFWRITVAP